MDVVPKPMHAQAIDINGPPAFSASYADGVVSVRGESRVRLGHSLPGRVRADAGRREIDGGARDGGTRDGVYLEWEWDGSKLVIRNDRYGFHPAYCYVSDSLVMVSPSLPALLRLGAPASLDEEALAVFLRIGYFVGDDTPFSGIRALPPNVDFEWRPGQWRMRGGRPNPPARSLGRADAIEAYIALFRAAMEKRLPSGGYVFPLSGGRDSRQMLLQLCAMGAPPEECVTGSKFPPEPQDFRVASELCASLGVPHRSLPSGNDLRNDLFANPMQNFCADQGGWLTPLAAYLGDRTHDTYVGIGGGELTALMAPSRIQLALFEAGNAEELARRQVDLKRGASIMEALLSPEQKRRMSRDAAIARIATEYSTHLDAPVASKSFAFWNHVRREHALGPYALFTGVQTIYAPYLDHDLFDFLCGLPLSLLDDDLHLETIASAFPSAAGIAYANGRDTPGYRLSARRRWLAYVASFAHEVVTRRTWRYRADGIAWRLLRALASPARISDAKWLIPRITVLLQIESMLEGSVE
jgi:hypothetical protein